MINELSIKKFAVIDDIRISFKEGLSVLTGETGAGKSIIIAAVNLLLGARASADLVRSGFDQAELEAFFDIDTASNAADLLKAQGSDPSEGLIIRRIISANGKSKIFINSKRSTLDMLKKVTLDLAAVSSQHAHQGLLREENQVSILDEFAGLTKLRNQVEKLYHTIVPLKNKADKLKRRLDQQKKEQDFLKFQIKEIREANIAPDEDEYLERKQRQLLNATKIFEAIQRAIHEIHDRERSVIGQLSSLQRAVEQFSDADDELNALSRKMNAAIYDLQDIVNELRVHSSRIDLDPDSLNITEERISVISKLKRKYGGSLDALFAEYETLQKQLRETTGIEKQIDQYKTQIEKLTKEISEKCAALSRSRQAAAKELSELAGKELNALEMGNARLAISFSFEQAKESTLIATLDKKRAGPDGIDMIQFLISPNPGEELKPLSKIASGGELSRIVLALKAVLSKQQSTETLIFDEVDSGIGGAASEKVGMKLKRLSQTHQVICITHLAQIAKYAENQFRISKSVSEGRTFTHILPLPRHQDRVDELARMIGGTKITEATRQHARELLENATF